MVRRGGSTGAKLIIFGKAGRSNSQLSMDMAIWDELERGLGCARQAGSTIDSVERHRLLQDADAAYENALYWIRQAGEITNPRVQEKLIQLETLVKT